jgi:hypothetical protein
MQNVTGAGSCLWTRLSCRCQRSRCQ